MLRTMIGSIFPALYSRLEGDCFDQYSMSIVTPYVHMHEEATLKLHPPTPGAVADATWIRYKLSRLAFVKFLIHEIMGKVKLLF